MDQIHLVTDIEFGALDIRIADDTYTLSLASALVVLEKQNANIVAGSKYTDILDEGGISSKASESVEMRKDSSIDVGVSLTSMLLPKGRLGGKSSGSGGKKSTSNTDVRHRVDLVIPAGQDGWRVGGSKGNQLLETRDLRGPAINSRHGDVAKPLCTLEAVDPTQPVNGRIRVQATMTDFRLGSTLREAEVRAGIGEGLGNDQPALKRRERAAERELKLRVATLALLLPMRGHADDGVFDVASRSFSFVPENDPVVQA